MPQDSDTDSVRRHPRRFGRVAALPAAFAVSGGTYKRLVPGWPPRIGDDEDMPVAREGEPGHALP